MIKNTKKGFTILELLAMIIILAVIFLIAMSIIPNIMGAVYKRVCTINEGMMQKAAFNFYSLGKDDLPSKEGEIKEVSLDKLITSKSIKAVVDPKTKQVCDRENSKVMIKMINGDYQISSVLKCQTCIDGKQDTGGYEEEMWDGWITLVLYYPESSTERKWRLSEEGEVRFDPMLHWQDYTGPITIPLNRVEDVWISYEIDGVEFVIPPAGRLLVDIRPDYKGRELVDKINVSIKYDDEAELKEYRVGGSGWMDYTGPFVVTENIIIEARAKKQEKVYDQEGNLLMTRNVAGRDIVYIGNIGIQEDVLEAPTLTRLPAQNENEVARVRITYPDGADKKIFKLNYGLEETYTNEISIKNFGTRVIGYYYNNENKRSKARSILINDTTMELESPQEDYNPNKPGDRVPTPDDKWVPAPTISINPNSGRVEEVEVSVNAPANADEVYLKLGTYGTYEKYTRPVVVRDNMTVYAYYKTYEGYRSDTGYGYVRNIKKQGRPYVRINADPYPTGYSYGEKQVNISIAFEDSNINEYSLNGLVYKPYTGSFTLTENTRLYARGTNDVGITETYLDISNIGDLNAPYPLNQLNISINATPDPSVTDGRVESVVISIDYDVNATEKYYRIGRYGAMQTYTGEFTITKNSTIYAYALGKDAKGQASKNVDNLLRGITDPIIRAYPSRSSTYEVGVYIEYDRYATIKRYSIDNGPMYDYSRSFNVSKNGTRITAYSENKEGETSESTYVVKNIVERPPVLIVDKGMYFILKLNYPLKSSGREYKWKQDGVWKTYKPDGIMLIKPQYKDEIIKDGTIIKIEDENGNIVTFKGDYYLIDVPITEIAENLFMRWDKEQPPTPQILPSTTEPTREVTVNIIYDKTIIHKEYKIVTKDGVSSGWLEYKGPITIKNKGTTVYARGLNSSEVWSNDAIKRINNIDDEAPTIIVTGDLETPQQNVALKVVATDDTKVGTVKWAPGNKNDNYFAKNGTEIMNNSIVTVHENGEYTFYVEDQVGNTKTVVVKVENIDKTPPKINIITTPEDKVGTESIVTINYTDSVTKQYKVGTTNPTWITYTGSFTIDSYNILSKGWQNEDNTVTIYAKGKDVAGNEATVYRKVYNLDLDIPKTPIVKSNYGYPILTSYGVVFDGSTTIEFDSRTDVEHSYSTDNGVTWKTYAGEFQSLEGTIIAKSVKRDTGLTTEITHQINMPADAIGSQAYDSDLNTGISGNNKIMLVDSSMQGKAVFVKFKDNYGTSFQFLDNDKNLINEDYTSTGGATKEIVIEIPSGTKYLNYNVQRTSSILYEIYPSNEPKIMSTDGYMLLHADSTKMIRVPYQMITIKYFPTSVERLYRVSTEGLWLQYNDQPIRLNQDETIYVKGIDNLGNETRMIPEYTANVIDAIGAEAFDGDLNTGISGNNKIMLVDSSMQGKSIFIKFKDNYGTRIQFLDDDKNLINEDYTYTGGATKEIIIEIPSGTKYLNYNVQRTNSILYEIYPSNEPTMTSIDGYMLLHADPTKTIRSPYQMVTLNYFPTSVERLYKIGENGDWLHYQNKPIKLIHDATIYAKGVDRYNNDTRITSSYKATSFDAITKEALDNNLDTYMSKQNSYILIDSSMYGKTVRVKFLDNYGTNFEFLDNDKKLIDSSNTSTGGATLEKTFEIPQNTKYIKYVMGRTDRPGRLYEIIVE